MRPALRLSLTLGAAAATLAATAWSWPAADACWRLTPVSLASWRNNLQERAIEAGTPDPRTDLADAALAAELLSRSPLDRDAPAWRAVLKTARESASQPVEGLPESWRERVHGRERDAAVTFFFRGDEPPFAAEGALVPAEGGPVFVRDPAEPAWLFEVARVAPGEIEGRLQAWQFRTSRWELPSSLAHPYRRASLGLGLLAVAALLLAPLVLALSGLGRAPRPRDPSAPEATLPNTRRRLVIRAFIVAAVAFGLLFLPPAIGLRGMDGGFALQFVAVLVMLSALATGAAFWNSAVRMGRLLSGQDLVARWRYSGAEWQAFVAGEGPRLLAENRALFRLVLTITVIVGLGFVAVAQDEASVVVFGGLMGFMVVLKAWPVTPAWC